MHCVGKWKEKRKKTQVCELFTRAEVVIQAQ